MNIDIQRVRDLHALLEKDKNVPIDVVIRVLESGDKTVPFNPEITFSQVAENLPVCQAVRAQRVDILELLIYKYHADTNFSFCLTFIPVVGTMDLVPAPDMTNITFQNFIFLSCCTDFVLCNKMLAIASKGEVDASVVLNLPQDEKNSIDIHTIPLFVKDVHQLPVDKDGRTALHHIALNCNSSTSPDTPAVALLSELTKGIDRASIEAFDSYELTALQYACWVGSVAAVRVFIAAGADVNNFLGFDSCTPLHLAVAAQSIDVVHELLHAGAGTTTTVTCEWVENNHVTIDGDPSDVARAAGNFRLARYVADPLRSSLGVLLDSPAAAEGGAAAIMSEPCPGKPIAGTCEICLEDTQLIPLSRCHHAFCKSCLADWFRTSNNGVTRPQCPCSGCNLPVSIYDIKAILGKAEANRVEELLLQRCLAEMPDFRWCPNCNSGGFYTGLCTNAVCDRCHYSFCTQCQQRAHPGISCEAKCRYKVEANRVKLCPGCHVPIVKDGGCSHMTCRRCGYQFCWFCMGKYQGYYTFEEKCPCPKKR